MRILLNVFGYLLSGVGIGYFASLGYPWAVIAIAVAAFLVFHNLRKWHLCEQRMKRKWEIMSMTLGPMTPEQSDQVVLAVTSYPSVQDFTVDEIEAVLIAVISNAERERVKKDTKIVTENKVLCHYFSRNGYIMCAVHPCRRSCLGCSDYRAGSESDHLK